MKVRCRVVRLCLALLLFSLPALSDTGSASLKPDVRLLIDNSGSMKVSDPDNLRAPALELIVRLLPPGSRAGVWLFGENVRELVPYREIDAEWRERAVAAAGSIDNSGQLTNIPLAIQAATADLDSLQPGYRTSIVLLTDGKVDVAESPTANARASRHLLEVVAPLLGETGVTVHTVALSDDADWKFLRRMAQRTGGISEVAPDAEQLTALFLQALEMVAPREQVPLQGSRFKIDDSVREFSALVFAAKGGVPLSLRAPDGAMFTADQPQTGTQWFSNSEFSLVTVVEPQAGEWQLISSELTNARIAVISDLRLEVDPLPNSLPFNRSAELGLRLRDAEQVIVDPLVLDALEISLQITDPDGLQEVIDVTDRYSVPADGEYRIQLVPPNKAGRYGILVRVDGQTFQREIPMYVQVLPRPQSVSVSTRTAKLEDPPMDNYLPVGIALVLMILVIWLVVHLRRRKRMQEWKQRYQNNLTDKVVEGIKVNRDDTVG